MHTPANTMISRDIEAKGTVESACRLLIIGDSHAARWTAESPAGWQVTLAGMPGATASTIAEQAPAIIAATRPDALLVMAGTNDARAASLWPWGSAIVRARAALAGIAKTGQAAGARVIIADLLPPGPQPWWRAALIGDRQARAMDDIMSGIPLPKGTILLKTRSILSEDGKIDPAFRSDHLHLSAAGYARLAAALPPLLQAVCPA